MRILLVEDDKILADALCRALVQSAHAVDVVGDGAQADHALALEIYDLAILDIGLPALSGLDVLRRLRARKSRVPVLMLTAFDTLADRVLGLDLGADDYLAKPFDLPELEARVRALIRRGSTNSAPYLVHGRLRLDTVGRRVHFDDVRIELSAREFAVLDLAHDRSLQEIAREVALQVRPNGLGPRLELSPAVERVLLLDQDDQLFFRVSGDNGTFIGGDQRIAAATLVRSGAGSTVFFDTTVHGKPVRMVAAWMQYGGSGADGRVLVQVAETLNKRNRLAWEILASVFVPQVLLVLLAAAVVHFGVSRGLLPLKRLQTAVSNRSHLDLSPIDVRDVPGEVRPLVDEVNELMLRLGTTLNFQNRVIADAAHQLKTPVSGLKAQIELALRECDPARVQHCLAQLYMSADRMSRLVRQLLSLARNEPGAVSGVDLQPVDLNALAVDVAMQWVPNALVREIDLGFEAWAAPVMIQGESDRLRELINNLIDNAVRYSRHGGRVTVAVAVSSGREARLSISDDSEKIPIEQRKRIFERFHRLLGSNADGSGLGLAIVSEIAALHEARITLEEDVDGVGNTFSIFFRCPRPRHKLHRRKSGDRRVTSSRQPRGRGP